MTRLFLLSLLVPFSLSAMEKRDVNKQLLAHLSCEIAVLYHFHDKPTISTCQLNLDTFELSLATQGTQATSHFNRYIVSATVIESMGGLATITCKVEDTKTKREDACTVTVPWQDNFSDTTQRFALIDGTGRNLELHVETCKLYY